MTTAQLDHLRAIDAHLASLIETAKKRTPGRWQQGDSAQEMNMDMVYRQPHKDGQAAGIATYGRNSGLSREQDERDASYIASCAGNAEAGWIATRAAIAVVLNCRLEWDDHMALLNPIIAAFPLELLESTSQK